MASLINGKFKGKDIISLDQFSPSDLKILFSQTDKMKKIAMNAKPSKILNGNIVTLLFYEPSSRTFGSFSAAIKQLGGQTVEIINPQQFSSVAKGETFEDTIRVFEAYCDAIVLRHPQVGSARKAADAAFFVPIISAGDGIGEHPTQALLDLYTIYEKFKRLNNLTILFAGDILYGRTVHSLLRGFSLFKNNTIYLLSPKQLKLSEEDRVKFSKKLKIFEIYDETQIPKADVWYWTRVQKERFPNLSSLVRQNASSAYEKIKNKFVLTPELIKKYAKINTVFMHPLPRVGEIDPRVDIDSRALYLRNQTRNGMYVRMALLGLVLGKL